MLRAFWIPLAGATVFAAPPGAVYTMTNWASGNAVVEIGRAADGTLGGVQFFATGGAGTEVPLDSQSSLAISSDGRFLLAVNAGSHTVSVLAILPDGALRTASIAQSRGFTPVSVAVHGDVVFVLNAGPPANLAGFRLESGGSLTPIPGATQILAGASPVQIGFDPSGTELVVTDKGSNLIEVFTFVNNRLAGKTVHPAAAAGPSGFGFAPGGRLIVAQAGLGAPDSGSVSSYQLGSNARLGLLSRNVPTSQTGTGWVAVTPGGRFAFASNAGSSSITCLAIADDGTLQVNAAAAGLTLPGSSPADLALTPDGGLLYGVASGSLFGFSAGADGRLTPVTLTGGLPPGLSGLVIR